MASKPPVAVYDAYLRNVLIQGAFDALGNLWTMVDRLTAITPEADLFTILDDGNSEKAAELDPAWH